MSMKSLFASMPGSFVPVASGILQRKCACGQHTGGGDCDECKKKHDVVQRRPAGKSEVERVPPIVHDVLRSAGQPLDASTRAFMGPRLGHDLSAVRVHTGAAAEQSAASVDAMAYTVGNNMVFNRGQFAPSTFEGRKLIAHELTHVVQQSFRASTSADLRIGETNSPEERAADLASSRIVNQAQGPSGVQGMLHAGSSNTVQRQPNLPGPAPTMGGLDLTLDLERGRVDLTVSGPSNTPVVSKPTIGLRRDASGRYHMLVGGKDKVVTIDEIPGMLRAAVGGQSGASGPRKKYRIPTCSQLQLHGGKEKAPRYMTFDQYKIQQRVWHGAVNPLGGETWLELTQALFDAMVEFCSIELRLPPRVSPEYNDAPKSTLPAGSAYA